MTPEGKVKERVREALSSLGESCVWSMPMGTAMGASGVADFDACIGGLCVKIETKAAAKDKPSVLQADYLRRVHAAGGIALVIDKDNVGHFEEVLGKVKLWGALKSPSMLRENMLEKCASIKGAYRWRDIKPKVIKGL